MRWSVIWVSLLLVLVTADKHLNTNGPFGKRHSFHDEPSPYACKRDAGLSLASILLPTTLRVATLNVSATVYSSNEQIDVTWTPVSSPCKDDFVGIYFSEIPSMHGKY